MVERGTNKGRAVALERRATVQTETRADHGREAEWMCVGGVWVWRCVCWKCTVAYVECALCRVCVLCNVRLHYIVFCLGCARVRVCACSKERFNGRLRPQP